MFSTTKHRSDAMDNLGYRNGSQDINRHVLDKEDSPNLGLPWFVGKDVCDILGTTNPTMVMDRLEPLCLRIKLEGGLQNEPISKSDEQERVYYTDDALDKHVEEDDSLKQGFAWFVGKDVTLVLGYSNPSKALSDHVDKEDKLNNKSLSSLGQRGGWIINESGLYALIFGSKLESAKRS